MSRKRFRYLLLGLAVLLLMPQWSGAAAAAEQAPDPIDSISSSTTGGTEVSDFYNVIMQVGADPWVYKHTDGYYYNVFVNASGIMIRRSKAITGIDAGERSLAWTPVKGTMYSSNVWAPEMHYLKDTDGSYKWYIYFAADDGTNANHRMYVLENASDNPMTGAWEFKGKITDSTDRWAIDGTVLTVNEKQYFIWSGWEETDGSFQNLYIAEMSDPRTIGSERVLISTPDHDWETSPGRINEGPEVTIHGNTINLVYSANGSWTDSYCLGLITAQLGDDLMDPGSWVKKDQPIFSSANGVNGPGHHSLTTSPDGSEDWIIYHSARWSGSGWTRNVRAQKFTWNEDGTPNLGEPVDPNKPIAIPSGEPVRQRFEAEAAQLVKDPSGETGPSVLREKTASDGKKITNMKNANDKAQFTVHVPEAGMYVLSVRNANGTSSAADASHILSVNGNSGAKLSIVYSGWNRWGASTAKVYLEQGDNIIRFSTGANLAEIDSMDVFKLDSSELVFDSPGYTLGLGDNRSLPVYMVTGTTNTLVDSGVTFSSSDNQVAQINGSEIKGIKAGSATITATYNGKTATTTVVVNAEPKSVQSIAISGLNNILTSGMTSQLQLLANYNTYEVQDVTAGATYSSSNPDVAKISDTGEVYDVQQGDTVITAAYGGKETTINLMVTPDPSQAPQVVTQVKTPSGATPKLPGVVDVEYKGASSTAEVSWKLDGIDFNSLGIVQVPVLLTLNGEEIPAAASVEVIPGWGLDEIVKQARSRIDNFSYPLGEGLGSYSRSAYDALLAKLDHAEKLSTDASLTEEQFNEERISLAELEADLLGSLNSTQDGVFYNAYRDFSSDETGKYPFGFNIEDLTNGAAATVQEEEGNKFLRLTTTATAGKANLFLPYLGEVTAAGDERIVIEYRARLNTNFQYANGAMTRNDSGTGNYSMVTAFDTGKIMVQNGGSKKSVLNYALNTWYNIKMVANWDAKTYTVYINDDPAPVATDYTFRHTGGSKLTGQRFGIDGYANASIDFDDFKVMVTGGAKSAPEGLGTSNETAAGANDGRITGVNASMEWSSNDGSTWSPVEGEAIANLPPGTYWIRYRETDTHKASPHVELTIKGYDQPTSPGGGESSGSTNTSTTVKNEDGSTTIIVTDKTTGTVTETTTWPNGIKVETVTTSLGEVTASVHLPQGVAEARITIPAKNASPSTVAYTVKQDGTRKIIGDSVLTKDGVSFIARGDMTVKLIDNKIAFKDVPDNHWAAESIAFTASRELFLGTGQDLFTPNASMSRAMLFAVLARLGDIETEGGANWYSKAQDWAVTAGISDGSAPDAAITREQLITLLYRYAGQPAASGNGKSFADSGEISAYAREAMEWAVARGILNGKPRNLLEPASSVTRAEVSAILARFIASRTE
ncbi:family 43 glycosylhydrolase [Paenibacillus glycanilyticus]|uniref:family 43 glycosylhydrolase n=1 Tax=Paenibacillus glycanilyticus TaxID=126569 RepID=UPI00203A55A2|nr:family 43 glycosylhydrolase [Paenibacillus glycanilyticus]MCM3628701.1 family 43 glycosylhydrolase [Paenibacillus glycanilyticus]